MSPPPVELARHLGHSAGFLQLHEIGHAWCEHRLDRRMAQGLLEELLAYLEQEEIRFESFADLEGIAEIREGLALLADLVHSRLNQQAWTKAQWGATLSLALEADRLLSSGAELLAEV